MGGSTNQRKVRSGSLLEKRQPVFSQEGGGTVHLGLTCGVGQNCESLI